MKGCFEDNGEGLEVTGDRVLEALREASDL